MVAALVNLHFDRCVFLLGVMPVSNKAEFVCLPEKKVGNEHKGSTNGRQDYLGDAIGGGLGLLD